MCGGSHHIMINPMPSQRAANIRRVTVNFDGDLLALIEKDAARQGTDRVKIINKICEEYAKRELSKGKAKKKS